MRVAVIGAGVSGLAAAKCLMDEGITPVVYEQSTELGGIWRYDEALPDGGGPAYRGLNTNTPKQTTAFSDYPFPTQLPNFLTRAEMLGYLHGYAREFRLSEHIRFGTEVQSVQPAGEGRWKIATTSSTGKQGEIFDAVMVGSGVFRDPIIPPLPGIDSFAGTIMHSRAYTIPEPFSGQRVLVVGSGSSATDVAVEVSAVAEQVYMAVRSTTPSEDVRHEAPWRRLIDWLVPPTARTRLLRRAALAVAGRGIRRGRVLPDAPFVLGPAPFTPSPKLKEPLRHGAVLLKPGISGLDGKSVVFMDGTREEVDTIIFATGYALSFPFLDASIVPPAMDGLDLYRLVFPPDWPTLAFIGMFRVSGPAPPVAEMQARWAARVFRGKRKLPSPGRMRAEVTARRSLILRTGGNPFRLNAEAYQDLLAKEIGALPRLWRHPRLLRALLLGPPVAAWYRLDGPASWRGAEQAILDAQGTLQVSIGGAWKTPAAQG